MNSESFLRSPVVTVAGEILPEALFVKRIIEPHPSAASYVVDGVVTGVETALCVGNMVHAARERDWPAVALSAGTAALAGWATVDHISWLRSNQVPNWEQGSRANKLVSLGVVTAFSLTQRYINKRLAK